MTIDEARSASGRASGDGGSCDLQVLPVEGSQLTYRVRGEGPPVLLVHGAFGMLEVWDEIQASLAATHRVLTYDRRGHGRSPNGTSDIRVHARDATALVERVAGEPAIVVGWSGGAAVAMEMVRTHREQVRAAVLVEPAFHLPRHDPVRSLRLLLAYKRHSMRGRTREAAETMARFAFARGSGGDGWDELDDRRREWFLGDAGGLATEFKVLTWHNTAADHISAKEVSRWSVPMTYLLGEDTAPSFDMVHRALTKAAPQIRTIRVPGACHLLPLQQPGAVVEAVRST